MRVKLRTTLCFSWSQSSRTSLSHLQQNALFQVLVGSVQQLFGSQNAIPHHVLSPTPEHTIRMSDVNLSISVSTILHLLIQIKVKKCFNGEAFP